MKAIGVNPVTSEPDRATAVFVGERPRMLRIACRTLGSVGDAEDIVQEAWLRWQRTDRAVVTNPAAFLTTTTSRLALNTATSARRRHEGCTDPQGWDPADPGASPADGAERAEAVGRALLLLLQTLSPMERAAYVLREAFGYPYQRIGALLRVSSACTRQLVARARQGIGARARRPVAPAAHSRLVRLFLAASRSGNLSALEQLLVADAVG